MKRNTNLLFCTAALAVFFVFASCSHNKSEDLTEGGDLNQALLLSDIELSMAQFESSGMQIGKAGTVAFKQLVTATGYISTPPTGRAKINALISGKVKSVSYASGDKVTKGAELFTIQSNEVISLQQDYAEAFYALEMLRADYERQKILAEENIASGKNLQQSKSAYMSMRAVCSGLKAKLGLLNIDPAQVEKGNIVASVKVLAPISGVVVLQKLVLGQHLDPNETALEIVDMSQLYLELFVFEKELEDIYIGQKVLFNSTDDPHTSFEARISKVGSSIDPETRKVPCIAVIEPGQDSRFIHNMYIEASIITCEREALAIPEEALLKEEAMYYVYALKEQDDSRVVLRKTQLEVGVIQDGYAEILDEDLGPLLLKGSYNLGGVE